MDRVTGFFHRLTNTIGPFAAQLGAPGLALVAFFDSSFLSLPEVADALLVLAVVHNPVLWPYYAAATTVGSIAGCYALFAVARKGGDAFLRRRMKGHHIDRALRLFQRFGLLAIIVPSILPPPMPFKVFVLLSGIANIHDQQLPGGGGDRTRDVPVRRRSLARLRIRRRGGHVHPQQSADHLGLDGGHRCARRRRPTSCGAGVAERRMRH